MDAESHSILTGLGGVPTWEWVVLVGSLALSALFSIAETVLMVHGPARTQQLIEQHPRWASTLGLWLRESEQVLTTILIGNNLLNTATSVLMGDIASRALNSEAIGIAIALATFMILVFVEITPKAFAKDRAGLLMAPVLYFIRLWHWVLYPVSWPLARFIRLMIGRKAGDKSVPTILPNEIQYLISLGEREKVLDADRADMLDAVFDLSHTVAREVMTPRTEMNAIRIGSDLKSVMRNVIDTGHSRIPVFKERIDNIIGVLYVKDLMRFLAPGGEAGFDLEKRLRPVEFVPENQPIIKLLKTFQKERTHMAVVVDEYGGVSGVVTLEDVLEEIVGPIQDEYDVPEQERLLVAEGDNAWLVDAGINVEDLEEQIEIKLPEASGPDEYDTLGGYVVSHFDRVPDPGAVITLEGIQLTVRESDGRRVRRVLIQKMETPSGENDEKASA